MKKMLLQEGFKQDDAEQCMYTRRQSGHLSLILAYVDHLTVAAQLEKKLIKEVIKELGDATFGHSN